MIAYLEGKVIKIYEDSIVVLTAAGIGFQVYVPRTVFREVNTIGHEIYLNTYMQVREDGMFLYGFLDDAELSMFKNLIGVSGVGPKAAIALLSALSPTDLVFAILSGDTKTLSTAQGVGKKMAEKIILFLKEKVEQYSDGFGDEDTAGVAAAAPVGSDVLLEAAQALNVLGFSMTDAMKTVKSINVPEGAGAEDIVKLALKKM